jgi:photosynthetic reaction center cytochrome c subunit
MKTRMHVILGAAAAAALLAGCERPPVESVQHGFRGTGMVELYNPRTLAVVEARNVAPAPTPPVPGGGPPAKQVFQNVQVLGDLEVGEFTRLMVAMTAWVSPEQGCNYCHEDGNLASDKPYTKVVARKMLEMTRTINSGWKNHVAATGVTCYTCHRGKPVPEYTWTIDPGPKTAMGMAGNRNGQNFPAPAVGLTSLPYDPFEPFLSGAEEIRVIGTTALPTGNRASTMQTENTYALMMHLSGALGVNCTYCHNTRSFAEWDGSTPQRATAWHGLRMVRALNRNYLEPLTSAFPAHRKGVMGDVQKVDCATCHQGAYKPLFGAAMLKDYPALGAAPAATAAAPTPPPQVTAMLAIVYFAVGSPAVPGELPAALQPLATQMKSSPRATATISGYHSATGDAAVNHELAKTRATNVRDALVAAGVPAQRLVLEKPYVEQANILGEDPKARRVEVTVK